MCQKNISLQVVKRFLAEINFMPVQKQLLIASIFLLPLHFSAAQKLTEKSLTTHFAEKTDTLPARYIPVTDSIINYGKLFLDTPYRYGASGTSSFDCSGFTSHVYRNFGYNLERSSADQATQFDTINPENLKTGDLVFFSGRRKSQRVGHVGIVVAKNDSGSFDFIHASVQKGVTISNSEEDYYKKRFIKANRVIFDNKMLAVIPRDAIKENSVNTDEPPMMAMSQPVQPVKKETKKVLPAEYHKVKRGENLSVIAEKHGISVAELKRKNGLKNSGIQISQRLKVKDEKTITVIEDVQLAENKPLEKTSNPIAEKSTAEKIEKTSITSHKVQKGETLFSISKLYNISVDDLKKMNQLSGSVIHFGDELKLQQPEKAELAKAEVSKPTVEPAKPEVPKQKTNNEEQIASTTHKVNSGETLFSISKKYNISIDDLKKMNQLTSSNIRPGQVLNLVSSEEKAVATSSAPAKKITHKVGPGESFYSIARNYGCSIDDLKNWNNKTSNKLNKGEKLIVYPKTI